VATPGAGIVAVELLGEGAAADALGTALAGTLSGIYEKGAETLWDERRLPSAGEVYQGGVSGMFGNTVGEFVPSIAPIGQSKIPGAFLSELYSKALSH
jgi:hypothetical protein